MHGIQNGRSPLHYNSQSFTRLGTKNPSLRRTLVFRVLQELHASAVLRRLKDTWAVDSSSCSTTRLGDVNWSIVANVIRTLEFLSTPGST